MGTVTRLGRLPEPVPDAPQGGLPDLLSRTARGDTEAFTGLYDALAPIIHGVVLRVVRDPAQSEEVTQEVLIEVWKQASRYDVSRGTVRGWVLTMAHRRAVDRVRSAQASTDREEREIGRAHV